MSRYYSLIIMIMMLQACSMKAIQNVIPLNLTQNSVNEHFQEADLHLMYALDSKYREDYALSATYFEKLYDAHKELLYMYEAIKNRILLKDSQGVKKLLDKALEEHPKDHDLQRYLAAYYLDKGKYKEARALLSPLVESDNNERDRLLLATTQLGLGEDEKALSYYEKAYAKDKSASTLIPLVNVLYYKLEQKKRAKQLLYAHTDFVECNEKVCIKLLEIYQKEQDLNGLLTISKKMYKKTHKAQFAKIALDIYAYQKDDEGVITFLEESHFDDSVLLRYYVGTKKFTKASTLAQKLYKHSGDLHFLAQEAMIEYESHPQPSQKVLHSVQQKFEKVIASLDDATYNNFYGYILIDHELDIQKGMALIKKALEKEPNTPFYIDSLAWGHYKLQEYQKAYELLNPLMIHVQEPEIKEHYQRIKEQIEKGNK